MKLDVGGWHTVPDPNEAQIRAAIQELDDCEGFLILGADDLTSIQSSGDSRVGFDLEYQEGSVDRHYRARRCDFDAETIIAKFAAYAAGEDSWKSGLEWEKYTF